jgi:hypothetical protein
MGNDRDTAGVMLASKSKDARMESMTLEPTLGTEFAGTCDLAIWCKLLHDKGWPGARIGRAIGKSEGYVNNLIRVVERASPKVMLRWRAEQHAGADHVCATDWLVALCILPHPRQDEELEQRIAMRPRPRAGSQPGAVRPRAETQPEVLAELPEAQAQAQP